MDIQELEVLDSVVNEAFDLSARERVLLKERVLTDFFGDKRVLEPFYLILVDVRLYLVPVKSLQLSVGTSLARQPPRQIVLHHVAHLDRIKSIRVETRPPKLVIPLVEKILTLLIEVQLASPAEGVDTVKTVDGLATEEQTATVQETELRLDLSGLSTDRPSPAATAHTADPAAPAPAAPADSEAEKSVGCCGARRAADGAKSPPNPPMEKPANTRTVKIYLNYFRKSHPESDWAFQQLRDAWSKQVLKRTLECDRDYLLLTTRRATVRLAESDYRLLFDALLGDLERAAGDTDELADLLTELFVSLKRYFIVKKLFWETPRLFELLVATMETVAKAQLSSVEATTEIDRRQHGNQLKVLLHALQALNCSFEVNCASDFDSSKFDRKLNRNPTETP